jgi:hypothetical protein
MQVSFPNTLTVAELDRALATIGLRLTSHNGAVMALPVTSNASAPDPAPVCQKCGKLATVHEKGKLWCSLCYMGEAET